MIARYDQGARARYHLTLATSLWGRSPSPRPPPSCSSCSWRQSPPPASAQGPLIPSSGYPGSPRTRLSRCLEERENVKAYHEVESCWVIPGVPGGAQLRPPVGILTIRESTAALLPAHGSRAIGLGRDFLRRFLKRKSSLIRSSTVVLGLSVQEMRDKGKRINSLCLLFNLLISWKTICHKFSAQSKVRNYCSGSLYFNSINGPFRKLYKSFFQVENYIISWNVLSQFFLHDYYMQCSSSS